MEIAKIAIFTETSKYLVITRTVQRGSNLLEDFFIVAED